MGFDITQTFFIVFKDLFKVLTLELRFSEALLGFSSLVGEGLGNDVAQEAFEVSGTFTASQSQGQEATG